MPLLLPRRTLLQAGFAACCSPLLGAIRENRFAQAAAILEQAVHQRQVTAAVLHVSQRESTWTRAWGTAEQQSMFLLGSISKPIAVTALLALYDRGHFQLDDPAVKFLPEFTGDGHERVTIRQLLTHVSGLPDQLPNNDALRRAHAPLSAFVEGALRTPLQFAPGTKYQYSSMAILLACRIAEVISGVEIRELVNKTVLAPLQMTRSAQGLGKFPLAEMVPCQTERAAPESGGGDPAAKDWDWNSPYWRELGAPWGGTHASAPDVARFLCEFLYRSGVVLRPATLRLMVENHLPARFPPRGLGFNVGFVAGRSPQTFGHTGSTGTIGWADPVTQTICVVLTSLPARAVAEHPRDRVSQEIAGRG